MEYHLHKPVKEPLFLGTTKIDHGAMKKLWHDNNAVLFEQQSNIV